MHPTTPLQLPPLPGCPRPAAGRAPKFDLHHRCRASALPGDGATPCPSDIHDDALPSSHAPVVVGGSAAVEEAPRPVSALDNIPPARLKELRKQGLAMKDVIKLGRLGVGDGIVEQIRRRWSTSEVAKLYCGGKPSADMKALTASLEERTGGTVIHRSGGSVFLYRGEAE